MNQKDNNTAEAVSGTRRYGLAMLTVAWLAILAMLLVYFFDLEADQLNPNRNPETLIDQGRHSVVLNPNRSDHYVMTGKINGREVMLLLDTGATNVAVPAKMARDLGLIKGDQIMVSTANGKSRAFKTRIDLLELGKITLRDVEADIAPGMNDMNGILLGMSALSRIEFSQRDGQLVLTQ